MDDKDTQIAELTAKIEELTTSVAEKEAVIAQKNQDIVGQRKQYKKLADMSQEEKDTLSQKELELQERQEQMEREQEEFKQQQADIQQKEVNARKDAVIKNLVGDNDEYAEKLRANMDRIKDAEEAITEEEIRALATDAFNMLGDTRPSMTDSINGTGIAPDGTVDGGFADTPQGKELENALGIATPEAPANPAT